MPRGRDAFTLFEMLVTISITAAIAALLMSSLSRARQQARALVCKAHLKDLGVGITNYAQQSDYWLPGSPGTSGQRLIHTLYGAGGDPSAPFVSTATDIPAIPTQAWDWAGPTAYWGLGIEDLPEDRAQRMAYLREGVFRCPDNSYLDLTYPYTQEHHRWPAVMRWNSYATIREFMYFGRHPRRSPLIHLPPNWDIRTPHNYRPQLTLVQRPAEKVLLAEGSPYWSEDLDAPHNFDVRYNARFGGGFSCAGPSSSWSRGYPGSAETLDERDSYAYRHMLGGDRSMEVLLFDAHVEALTLRAAVEQVDLWYPSATLADLDEFDAGPFAKPVARAVIERRPADEDGFRLIY